MGSKHSTSETDWSSLDRDGFVALRGLIGSQQVAGMKSRLEELLEITPQDHAGTLIVGGLVADPVFDATWNHPRILSAVKSVLGPDFFLSSVSSRGLRSGHGQQSLHTDWGGQGQPGTWYLCHAICALVDFTPENGATRVIPKSHKNPWLMKTIKDPRRPHPDEVQLIGEAGTIFILNVHCLHSAMHNASAESRLAIFSSFSRRDSPLLKMTPYLSPGPEVLKRFGAEEQALLTYQSKSSGSIS